MASSSAAAADNAPPPPPPIRRRGALRRLLLLRRSPERSPLLSSPSPPERKGAKKGFAAALRGLGCASASSAAATSSADADAAAAVRSSAEWQGKRARWRRATEMEKEKEKEKERRAEAERVHREGLYNSRRNIMQDHISSFIDSPPHVDSPIFGFDLLQPPRHLHHMRAYHRSPDELEEMMMFHTRVLLGGIEVYDRYHDWRLDVDNMSYEELLELGDKIGCVSTGLREEEIVRSLSKVEHSVFEASPLHIPTEKDHKCSICQVEYQANDETGRLGCGHSYHVHCIKQWLSQKNACPLCKTAVHDKT
ncbi:E3 ubiquitin-protein ligase MBR2 [Ananas comosus]|uniref:RING-type E3 ubiquitin transferase n=1 Tax=Ananas comosus TaxID=4615 RepID=A0A199V0M0_ANACO|nr:E3 ubiquitin-protein ligase MBR2 [Ananas comosus]